MDSLAAIGLISAIVLGVLIAVPIAWFNLSSHLANALQSESRTGTINRATQRLRHGFIVAQIALAFVLLAGAALLGLSLKKVMAVSPGFRADQILTGECTISWQLAQDSVAIVDRLLESIRQQPGIAAAGTITNIPLSGDNGKTAITPKGYVPPPGQSVHGHYSYGVYGDYFSAFGIPLREGRFLTSADSRGHLHHPATPPNASAWWTKILRGDIGPKATRSASNCFIPASPEKISRGQVTKKARWRRKTSSPLSALSAR